MGRLAGVVPILGVLVVPFLLPSSATAADHRCAGTRLDGGNVVLVASRLRSYRADAGHTLRCINARRVAKAYLIGVTACRGPLTRPCTFTVRGLGRWGCYTIGAGTLSSRPVTTQCEAFTGWTLRWRTSVIEG